MTAFTPDEQRTVMSLWSIARSPLMYGGDLPTSGEDAMALITNDEVLAVDQKGAHPKQLFSHDNQIAWVSDAAAAGTSTSACSTWAMARKRRSGVDLERPWPLRRLPCPRPLGAQGPGPVQRRPDLYASAHGAACTA